MQALTKHEDSVVNVLKTPVDVSPLGESKWMTFTGLWDTGATESVITSDVAKALGLSPVATTVSRGVGGPMVTSVYLLSIKLPGDIVFNLQVTEGEPGGGWDVLVGMDIISHGDFCVSNFGGKTVFSFRIPSGGETDYVQMIKDCASDINEA